MYKNQLKTSSIKQLSLVKVNQDTEIPVKIV